MEPAVLPWRFCVLLFLGMLVMIEIRYHDHPRHGSADPSAQDHLHASVRPLLFNVTRG